MNNIIFHKHHKHSQQTFSTSSTSKPAIRTTTTVITEELLEEIAFKAYLHAEEILSACGIPFLNSNRNMMSFEEVNRLAHVRLARSQYGTSKKKSDTSDNEEEQNEDDNDDDQSYQQQRLSEDFSRQDSMTDDEELLNIDELDLDILSSVSSSTFHGMRIFDSIDDSHNECFFCVELNGKKKYIHKQTGNWYFSKTKPILSCDRLKRVQNK